MFYVYLLHSTKDNGFYIGYSTDLKRRLSEHKRGASFATKSRGPWKLIYYEAYTEREDAGGRKNILRAGQGGVFCAPSHGSTGKKSRYSQPREGKAFYVATPLGFEPRITPPKGAVLPLHHGVNR